jgi:hypothetical protein
MAKNSVRDFDATAANNTDIQSVDISEGCAPSGINNAIRELMTDLKNVSSGAIALETPSADSMTVTGDLTVDTNTLKVDSTNNRVGVANASPSVELDVTGAAAISGDLTVDTSTLKVDSTNNRVGINQASPEALLHILGQAARILIEDSDDAGTTGIDFKNGSGDLEAEILCGTNNLQFHTEETERVRISSDGVGIEDILYHLDNTGTKIRFPSNNTIAFETSGGERGRFSSGGSLFIATTSDPSASNFGLKLAGSGQFSNYRNTGAGGEVTRHGGTAGIFLTRGDGDAENTNNRYSGISDQNLKENIVDAPSQWDDIKAVRVRKYSLIEKGLDAPDSIGVIAQELEASDMGGLVKDVDEGYKTVAYSVLYMKAVKALQEAMERIEVLEARVTTLEG